jgi:hypothetical protein
MMMKNPVRRMCRWFMAAALLSVAAAASAQMIDVYKLANCDCCGRWVEHIRSN